MDEESKVVAREKCDYVDPKIGYAEFYKNKTYLAEGIKSVNVLVSFYFLNCVFHIGWQHPCWCFFAYILK